MRLLGLLFELPLDSPLRQPPHSYVAMDTDNQNLLCDACRAFVCLQISKASGTCGETGGDE